MEYPIPFDWDGESWRSWAICWPDSPMWNSYLRGFVTYFTRGRAWDGKTGNIKAAQVIGWEIANSNNPLQEVALTCQQANELTTAVIMLAHAIIGRDFDGTLQLPNSAYLNGFWAFNDTGLANRLGPNVPMNDEATIQFTLYKILLALQELKDALTAGSASGEDLEDDLAKVWGALDDITEILGGDVSPPPDPL